MPPDSQVRPPQRFDAGLKDLIQQQAAEILPQLLPGVSYERSLNVEIIRPALRVDKVYVVHYRGKQHVLHLEFETGSNARMEGRMLAYNAALHLDHNLPVISMIIYPFKTKMAKTPFIITSGEEELVTFHFKMLPLFQMDAACYVQEHIICMYPLLPTMRNVDQALMKRVMDELVELHRGDEVTLAQQFVWMKLLLERTDTIPSQEKAKIKEVLNMYDWLWEESPMVQKMRAEDKAEGKAEGIVEGALLNSQNILVNLVKGLYPTLADLAQKRVAQAMMASDLDLLIQQVALSTNEEDVRRLLTFSSPTE